MATGSIVSKSRHGLVRDAHWADGPGATYIRCSNQEEGEERGEGRKSIWLNRNGKGDIFKPAKFGAWFKRGGAPGVPRISLHYLTI